MAAQRLLLIYLVSQVMHGRRILRAHPPMKSSHRTAIRFSWFENAPER